MSQSNFDRRTFLKLTAATLAGTALGRPLSALAKPYNPLDEDPPKPPFIDFKPARVLTYGIAVYDSLDPQHRHALRSLRRDNIVSVAGEFEGPGSYNKTWYQTRDGFVHSGWIQKMEPYRTPQVFTEVDDFGMWIEVIAPSASAYAAPTDQSTLDYLYYYGTTYRVTEVHIAEDGRVWYKTFDEYESKDDNIATTNHWVPAIFTRRIDESELAPINPDTPDKHILVEIGKQQLTCYEGDTPILTSRIASGATFEIDGEQVDYSTPLGKFNALLKMPSRHMRAPEKERDTSAWFDLPGVPWSSFFTYDGVAIHGTYWHNDFGARRSHGCVNVPIEVAKFVYQWTEPVTPYEAKYTQGDLPDVKSTEIMVV